MEVLASGKGVYRPPDPDGHREWVRIHKSREMKSKVMTEKEAVQRFVSDGDYLGYDLNHTKRGPTALFREIIRQKKKNLWLAVRFSFLDPALLIAGGCVSRIDIGWFMHGGATSRAIEEGKVKITEWSNSAIVYRQLAGSMGLPFLPMRYLGGSDIFEHSGAKLVKDPFTGKNIVLVPALNLDVAIVHVYQCDEYGNARIFGPGLSPLETATCAKKLIISTEEIISNEEIRRQPNLTTIPYYLVDAVVHLPFGSYPGAMPGLYTVDGEAMMEMMIADRSGGWDAYLDKWVYGVESHTDMLEKKVGAKKLLELMKLETIKEGYHA
jgi:acyl CoA:acetate/3-ketoacid CoA transferase alpha subunit